MDRTTTFMLVCAALFVLLVFALRSPPVPVEYWTDADEHAAQQIEAARP